MLSSQQEARCHTFWRTNPGIDEFVRRVAERSGETDAVVHERSRHARTLRELSFVYLSEDDLEREVAAAVAAEVESLGRARAVSAAFVNARTDKRVRTQLTWGDATGRLPSSRGQIVAPEPHSHGYAHFVAQQRSRRHVP